LKVSIITICFNSKNGLKKTIQSIREQTYKNIEHIVIDGGSTDGSLELLKSSKGVIYLSEPDQGLYDAMNKGLRKCSGDVIGFLNADDVFFNKNTIASIVSEFKNNKSIDGVFGNLLYINQDNTVTRRWRPGEFKQGSFALGWHPPHPTVYVKSHLYHNKSYRLDLPVCADFEMMLQLFEKQASHWKYIDSILVNFMDNGVSSGWVSRITSAYQIHQVLVQSGYKLSFLNFLWRRYKEKILHVIKK